MRRSGLEKCSGASRPHFYNTLIYRWDSYFLVGLLFSGRTLIFSWDSYFLAGLLFSSRTLIYWQDYYKRRSGRGPLVSIFRA